jgi:hypothetical protein
MGKVINREVIYGRATVTQARRFPKDEGGGLYVQVLVYGGSKAEGEPVAEWVMPIQLRYALSDAAHLAVRQTDFSEVVVETDVHTEHCCFKHGCKYDDEACMVENGTKPQSHPCEQCEFEEEG